MEDTKAVVIENSWKPDQMVEFANVLAWPIASLIIVILLRGKLTGIVKDFFISNRVSEVKAGAVSAKFVQSEQIENPSVTLPRSQSSTQVNDGYQAIIERQNKCETKYSEQLRSSLTLQMKSLNIAPDKEADLLKKEISLIQASQSFTSFNRVLYRSQYDLFVLTKKQGSKISIQETSNYFSSKKMLYPSVFGSTDLNQYLSYPLRMGVIEKFDGYYKLTEYGESYVEYMDRNFNLIDELIQN